jgi:hypothetical protein
VSAVSRIWFAILLLCAASCAWASEDCSEIRLTRAEAGLAMRAAQDAARFPIDAKSLSACRIGKHQFANFNTLHQAQTDGSEMWEGLGCEKGSDKAWICSPYLQRAVQFEPEAGAPKIRVKIPPDMDAASATRIVTAAYSQATEIDASKVCSHPLSATSYENFRRSFRNEAAGELELMPERWLRTDGKGLALNRGDFYVVLERSEAE